MAGIAAVLLFYGVALLALPAYAAAWWPWTLSELTARAVGAWLVGLGWSAAQGQSSTDPRTVRPAGGPGRQRLRAVAGGLIPPA